MALVDERELRAELKRSLRLDADADAESKTRTIDIDPDIYISLPYENTLVSNFYLIIDTPPDLHLDLNDLDITFLIYVGYTMVHELTLSHNIKLTALTGRDVTESFGQTKVPLYWFDILPHKTFSLRTTRIRFLSTYPITVQYDVTDSPEIPASPAIPDCYLYPRISFWNSYDTQYIVLLYTTPPDTAILHLSPTESKNIDIIYGTGYCIISLIPSIYDLESYNQHTYMDSIGDKVIWDNLPKIELVPSDPSATMLYVSYNSLSNTIISLVPVL